MHAPWEEECLQRKQPRDLGQTHEALDAFLPHYHEERPDQAESCQNHPPATAFPVLPELPPLPAQVDPDGWLAQIDGLRFTRMVGKDGRIRVDKQS